MDEWLRERLRTHVTLQSLEAAYCLTVRDAIAAGLIAPSQADFFAAAATCFSPEDRAFLARAGIAADPPFLESWHRALKMQGRLPTEGT